MSASRDVTHPSPLTPAAAYQAHVILHHLSFLRVWSAPMMAAGSSLPQQDCLCGTRRRAIHSMHGSGTRIELRSPDPSCNPYLAFAAILASGLDGIENKIDPGEPIEENIYEMDFHEISGAGIDTLPTSLSLALDYLESDAVVQSALGKHVYTAFMRVAAAEWEEYRVQVHQWELDRYLQLF
nr:glutamine synthetase [uncultured archaeon GZfos31B6]